MKLIVITGIDGAGKTTLQQKLAKALPGKVMLLHLPHSKFVNPALKVSGDNHPFTDSWTDRLIFALDNRLVGYTLMKLEKKYDWIVMQRGWMDSFISGGVQGYNYKTIAALTKPQDLPKAHFTIYLNCSAKVAYTRVENDRKRDKFETPEFLERQYQETERFHNELDSNRLLKSLFPEKRTYIDTTDLSKEDTFIRTLEFLSANSITVKR